MTSQRFLNDRVNLRDFLRSLLEACKAPIVALFFISLSVIGPVAKLAKALKQNLQYMELLKKHEIISYFGGITSEGEYSDAAPLSFMMILCGMAIALSLFSFAFKKNSVNVYFSVGLTRTRMFLNRLAAGTIWIFAVAIIPYLTVFLMNVGMFGFHSHQLKLFAYFTLIMFIRGMSGFAIGALAAAVSGSVIEMVITTGATSVIALLPALLLSGFKSILLPGYVSGNDNSDKTMLLSPWTGLLDYSDVNQLITGKKVPKELLLTWKGNFLPIAFWAIAAVIIFAVGLVLFKKRKNENAASFGKFAVASAINGSVILLISALILTDLFSSLYGRGQIKNVALCIILTAAISFIVFFVAELIIRRNFKAVIRILPVYGGIAFVTLASLLVIGTGYFGTYNKLPEAKDIEYISMSYDDPLTTFTYMANVYSPEDYDKENDYSCKSSNPEDIKMCIEQFNKVKTEKREGRNSIDRISFVIKTKDGKFIARTFPVYSEETYSSYNKAVFDSNYFHSIIKSKLNSESSNGNYTDETANIVMDGKEYGDQYIETDFYDYYNGDLLANAETFGYETAVRGSSFEMTEELKAALYEDLCSITYDEYYGNKGKPQGAIVKLAYTPMLETHEYHAEELWLQFYTNYGDPDAEKVSKKTAVANSAILVYPQMAKTAELLNETEQMPQTAQVKAVICPDKKLMLTDAFNNVGGDSIYYYDGRISSTVFISYMQSSRATDYFMNGDKVSKIFGGKMTGTYLDFIELIYGANDVNVTRVDDKDKAQKISDEAYTVYNTYNDNGRCIFVIYDDGSVIAKYLPEKAMSVLN